MADRLDMSLDDIIAKKKTKQPEGRRGHFSPRGRSYGPGPTRRPMYRSSVRSPPYFASPKMQARRRSMFEQGRVVSVKEDTEEGTKLYLSNLHYDVSNSDIELLFSDIGHLKRHSVHYDRSGRSKGTAEVIYVHRSDALTAIEKYNNLPLDGKRIKIELVGVNPTTPLPVLPRTQRFLRTPNAFFHSARGRVGARELSRGCGTADCGLEKGRAQIKKRGKKLTTEDLDADLENYRQRAQRVK